MAHLPQDQLPSEFDVVIDGTGLIQSILAAALARAGKSVLHIDRNGYYGELWGSLMHREMQQWIAEHVSHAHDQATTPPDASRDQQPHPLPYCPQEGETVLVIDRDQPSTSVTNLVEFIHTVSEDSSCGGGDGVDLGSECATGETGADRETSEGVDGNVDDGDKETGDGGEGRETGVSGGEPGDGSDSGACEVLSNTEEDTSTQSIEAPPTSKPSSKVTWQSIEPQWRRFNFDLLPKFLYCRGAMVDLISESSCSRYIEFRSVNGIYNYTTAGQIEQVPCSRSDVFSSKVVSMMEKRKMMKFLTFCSDFQSHPEQYQEFVSLSFEDYLKQNKLTPNLVNYIHHSIAMVTNTATTLEGLHATQLFINSVGRYGNSPFLFPIFGGGELPQAFCRLCAVYGGVYCLQRHVTSIISSDNTITSVVTSSGQQIKCSSVVLSAAFLSKTPSFKDKLHATKVSRGIFVTDSRLPGTDGNALSLVTLTPASLGGDIHSAIRVMQLDHASNNCPPGTFLVHMQCNSVCETAQQDLQSATRALFYNEKDRDSNNSGPRLLWSLYYNLDLHRIDQSQTSTLECPRGLYMTSEPDTTIGYEKAANEARELFARMCPGEEFLPHPPSPDDIIFEESANNHDDSKEQKETNQDSKNQTNTATDETTPADKTTPTGERTPTK